MRYFLRGYSEYRKMANAADVHVVLTGTQLEISAMIERLRRFSETLN